jgi:hypothetical protein
MNLLSMTVDKSNLKFIFFITTTLDSYFGTAIGITPYGHIVFSGSPKFIHKLLTLTML